MRAGLSGRTAARFHRRAFTLVEIVIAMTIVIILTAAAVPAFRGMQKERLAREPVQELTRLAKEARLRAMKEKRPYQIAFHQGGFTASRYLTPYLQLSQLNDFITLAEQKALEPAEEEKLGDDLNKSRETGDQVIHTKTAGPEKFEEWIERFTLPLGTRCTVQYWHELEPSPIEGEYVKLWVFQPTGIVMPLKVAIDNDAASFQLEYNALTADIVKEASDIK